MATKKLVFLVSLIAMLTLNGGVEASPLCRVWVLECCCEIPVGHVAPPAMPAPGVMVDVGLVTSPRFLPVPDGSKEVADASVEKIPSRFTGEVETFGTWPYTGPSYQRSIQSTSANSVSVGYPQPVVNAVAAGYTSYPGYGTYKVHKIGTTWYDAMAVCASEGATLTVINSQLEANLIRTMFRPNEVFPSAVNNMHFWVGAQERGTDGQFYTVFGVRLEHSGYQVWSPLAGGQPNDRGTTDCVSTFIDGGYFDDQCTYRYAFVCEKVAT